MKKKILKAKKAAPHAKASRPPQAKTCECCDSAPCACPATHGHKS
jgi:hypothetical protein